MNQLIKISEQSAKILKNYAECRIRRFQSNNKLLHTRVTSSLLGKPEPSFHYIQKFYKSHTKITLLNKETHQDF